jgi:predicted aspartyl protease
LALAVMATGAAVTRAGDPVRAEVRSDGAQSATATASSTYEVPLWLENGRLVVPVQVDGLDSLRFILDTAAESSAVTRALAERLAVDPSRLRRMRVVGVGGTRVMTSVALRSLSVGGGAVAGVRAIVVEGSALGGDGGFDGLLGNDVLRGYDVEIDVAGGRLRLHGASGAGELPGGRSSTTLPMKAARSGFVAFDATLAGGAVHAILDTGAPVSLVNWRAAALAGVSPETRGLRERRSGTAGLDGVSLVTHEHWFDGLALGATRFPASVLRIADLPLFEVAGVAAEPAMLIGVDLLRACVMILSYSTRTVRLCAQRS